MSLSFSVTATMRQGVWKLFPVVRAMKSSVEVTYRCCRHDDSRLKALPKRRDGKKKGNKYDSWFFRTDICFKAYLSFRLKSYLFFLKTNAKIIPFHAKIVQSPLISPDYFISEGVFSVNEVR